MFCYGCHDNSRTLAGPIIINDWLISIVAFENYLDLNFQFHSVIGCRYANGTHYLMERYHLNHPPYDDDLKFWMNFGLNFLFTAAMFFANIILHIVPLPAFVKTKFRGWATFSMNIKVTPGLSGSRFAWNSILHENETHKYPPVLIARLFCDHILTPIVT